MAARGDIGANEADGACENPRHRLCAATRLPRPIDELIRFVEGPDGRMVPDLRRRLPGRGVWLTADRATVDAGIKAKAFQRSLKHPVQVDPALGALVDGLLQQHALEALSLANKAGALTTGNDRVIEAIEGRDLLLLLHASDAAAGGVAKLDKRLANARSSDARPHGQGPKSINCFSNEQLSLALGRPNVVHAAIFDAPAASNFIAQTERLLRYRCGLGIDKSPETGLKDGTIRHE